MPVIVRTVRGDCEPLLCAVQVLLPFVLRAACTKNLQAATIRRMGSFMARQGQWDKTDDSNLLA